MARKISFGSHSDTGANTPKTLMTLLKTLKLRTKNNVSITFAQFLDQLAENPNIDVYKCLFDKVANSTCK
jgi:hypothetical protein